MPNDDATPVIMFIVSVYGFGVALLYALARAWEQALSTRPRQGGALKPGNAALRAEGDAVGNPSPAMGAAVHREDIRK